MLLYHQLAAVYTLHCHSDIYTFHLLRTLCIYIFIFFLHVCTFTNKFRVNSTALIKLMKDAGQVIPKELQLYAPTKKTFDSSSEEEDSDEE